MEMFQTKKNKKKQTKSVEFEIVVARYKEDVSYLVDDPVFQPFYIRIYNKGDPITDPRILQRCEVIPLPNVGKCDHTYLHHIVENYDQLADVTLFLPASCYFIEDRKDRLMRTIQHTVDHKISAFIAVDATMPIQDHPGLKDFVLDTWETSYAANKDEKSYELLPATTRPFGAWMKKHFPENTNTYSVYNGIFSASKQDIQHTPLEKYKEICGEIDHHKNPEAGHYIERAWISLFTPIQKESLLS
jgi:hypothetical protein